MNSKKEKLFEELKPTMFFDKRKLVLRLFDEEIIQKFIQKVQRKVLKKRRKVYVENLF